MGSPQKMAVMPKKSAEEQSKTMPDWLRMMPRRLAQIKNEISTGLGLGSTPDVTDNSNFNRRESYDFADIGGPSPGKFNPETGQYDSPRDDALVSPAKFEEMSIESATRIKKQFNFAPDNLDSPKAGVDITELPKIGTDSPGGDQNPTQGDGLPVATVNIEEKPNEEVAPRKALVLDTSPTRKQSDENVSFGEYFDES